MGLSGQGLIIFKDKLHNLTGSHSRPRPPSL